MSSGFGRNIRDCAKDLAQFWAFGKLCLKLLTRYFVSDKIKLKI